MNDLLERDGLARYIWDGYKDANGIRPRHLYLWDDVGDVAAAWTLDLLRAEADRVSDAVKESIAEDNAREARMAIRFETAIVAVRATGAADRKTAVRWLMEAEGCEEGPLDESFFKYLLGINYNYPIWEGKTATLADLL